MIRVPLLISGPPGLIVPGVRSETPVREIDLYPTLLELAGLPSPPSHVLDGMQAATAVRERCAAGK